MALLLALLLASPVAMGYIAPTTIEGSPTVSGDESSLVANDGALLNVSGYEWPPFAEQPPTILRTTGDTGPNTWLSPNVGACRAGGHFNCLDDSGFTDTGPSSFDTTDYVTTAGLSTDIEERYSLTDVSWGSFAVTVLNITIGLALARNESSGSPAYWVQTSLLSPNGTACADFLFAPASNTATPYWFNMGPYCQWIDGNILYRVAWTQIIINALVLRLRWVAPHIATSTIFAAAVSVHWGIHNWQITEYTNWTVAANFPSDRETLNYRCAEYAASGWSYTMRISPTPTWTTLSVTCDGTVRSLNLPSGGYTGDGRLVLQVASSSPSQVMYWVADLWAFGEPPPDVTAGGGISWLVLFALAGGVSIYLAWRFGKWVHER